MPQTEGSVMLEFHHEMTSEYEEQAKRILDAINKVEPGTQEYKELQINLKSNQEMADNSAKVLIMEKRADRRWDLIAKIGVAAIGAGLVGWMYAKERDPEGGVMFRPHYVSQAMRLGGL